VDALVLGVCSIRIFAKNIGNPHYEPTIVVHDKITRKYQCIENSRGEQLKLPLPGITNIIIIYLGGKA